MSAYLTHSIKSELFRNAPNLNFVSSIVLNFVFFSKMLVPLCQYIQGRYVPHPKQFVCPKFFKSCLADPGKARCDATNTD